MAQYILIALKKSNRYHPPTIEPAGPDLLDYVSFCHRIEDEFEEEIKAAIIVDDRTILDTDDMMVISTTPQAMERVRE